MTTAPVRIERRAGQRFPYLIPISLFHPASSSQGVGFTQDVGSRGVFFFTETPLAEGSEIELTLKMPSEITLGDSMRVRCRGRILRIAKPVENSSQSAKIGVAVRFEGYEYLADGEPSDLSFSRVATLHSHPEDDSQGPTLQSR